MTPCLQNLLLRLRFRWMVARRIKAVADACRRSQAQINSFENHRWIFGSRGSIYTGEVWHADLGSSFLAYFLIPMEDLLYIYPRLADYEYKVTALGCKADEELAIIRKALEEEDVSAPNILLRPVE